MHAVTKMALINISDRRGDTLRIMSGGLDSIYLDSYVCVVYAIAEAGKC
jgi:hypothetical protein